jgi:acetylornithine deacetylase/succinyl-diaminopimelate desuccinylase-like protein
MRRKPVLTSLFLLLLAAGLAWRMIAAESAAADGGNIPASRDGRIPSAHLRNYQELAVRWMQEYLQIDTTNPPGNELAAAQWFKRIFDAEGIENRLFEYTPGRADIWARIPAGNRGKGVPSEPDFGSLGSKGARRPLILLNHMDVVSSEPAHWLVPPFSGEIVDGSMYGRGAQDMKSEGVAQLLVMVMLQREQPERSRDVIFLATADEEVHDSGTDWLLSQHRELLEDAEFLITEGGENLLENDEYKHVGVDIAEKAPFWLHVVAHGQPGHGSHPIENSAPNRLVHALDRILAYQPELKVMPEVQELLAEMAPYQSPTRAARFRNIRQALRDKGFRDAVSQDDSLNYLLRDTISVTMLGGAKQTNVIPEEAWANLDVRLLPGEDPQQFLEGLRRVVGDSNVTIEPLDGFAKGNSSPVDTELFDAIRQVSARYFPHAPVQPRLASGYNESQRYRPLGITCYGFSPYMTTAEEGSTEHGDNERIRVEELRRGFLVLYDVVRAMQ